MVCPTALAICPSSFRNLCKSRSSLNSHSASSRSIQVSASGSSSPLAARRINGDSFLIALPHIENLTLRRLRKYVRTLAYYIHEHPRRESGAQQRIICDFG